MKTKPSQVKVYINYSYKSTIGEHKKMSIKRFQIIKEILGKLNKDLCSQEALDLAIRLNKLK